MLDSIFDTKTLSMKNSDDKLNQESSIQCAPNSAGHGYTHGLYECFSSMNLSDIWMSNFNF